MINRIANKLSEDFFSAAIWTSVTGFTATVALDATNPFFAVTAGAAALGSGYMAVTSAYDFLKSKINNPKP